MPRRHGSPSPGCGSELACSHRGQAATSGPDAAITAASGAAFPQAVACSEVRVRDTSAPRIAARSAAHGRSARGLNPLPGRIRLTSVPAERGMLGRDPLSQAGHLALQGGIVHEADGLLPPTHRPRGVSKVSESTPGLGPSGYSRGAMRTYTSVRIHEGKTESSIVSRRHRTAASLVHLHPCCRPHSGLGEPGRHVPCQGRRSGRESER